VQVATGRDPRSEQEIARRQTLADALEAAWTVCTSRRPRCAVFLTASANRRVTLLQARGVRWARRTVTLDGPSGGTVARRYAETRRATRVVLGAPKRSGCAWLLRPSTATELAAARAEFRRDHDRTHRGAIQRARNGARLSRAAAVAPPLRWRATLRRLAISAICRPWPRSWTPIRAVQSRDVYLLGVTAAGLWFGRGPSVLAAVLNVAAFDFFFVPPRFTFAVGDVQYLVTFAVMLTIALTIATLVASVRQQTRVAGARERRTAMLYAMSRELAATRGSSSMAGIAVKHVAEVFQCTAVVLLPDVNGKLHHPVDPAITGSYRGSDVAVAQWVLEHGRRAGFGSDTLPATPALYLPLGDAARRLGVLAVLPQNQRRVTLPEQLHLLETFAGQIGLALERENLAMQAESARVAAQGESLRNTLLASISHDLRTPLSVMAGAGSTLATHGDRLDAATRQSLAASIESRAREMSELVSNVLDLTRFEAGVPILRRDWESVDDLAAVALQRLEQRLVGHPIELRMPSDLPPVYVDASLVVQVFTNLLDNVAKYTPARTRSASAHGPRITRCACGSRIRDRDFPLVIPRACSTSSSVATAKEASRVSGWVSPFVA
jgi:two-component system sensor histidine kinase KdpD